MNKLGSAKLYLRSRLREGCFIFTFAWSVFLLVALFTYHRTDPSWSHNISVKLVANAGGRAGAWIADLIFYLVGYLAYLFPCMVTYAAWISFHERYETPTVSEKWVLFFFRLAGFLLLLTAGCAFMVMYVFASPDGLPFNSGGILGTVIVKMMLPVFNSLGTTLILIAIILIGITLFTNISWAFVLESAGFLVVQIAKQSGYLLCRQDFVEGNHLPMFIR